MWKKARENLFKNMYRSKNRNKSIKKLERELKLEFVMLVILLFLWFFFSFIAVEYAFSIDPALALIAFGLFFGLYGLYYLVIHLHKKTYIFLRKISDMWEKEGFKEDNENDGGK
jgi:hypothetical protein